jgi:hypothetical protein
VAVLGVLAAVSTIPGMPKLFHWDSDSAASKTAPILAYERLSRECRKELEIKNSELHFIGVNVGVQSSDTVVCEDGFIHEEFHCRRATGVFPFSRSFTSAFLLREKVE